MEEGTSVSNAFWEESNSIAYVNVFNFYFFTIILWNIQEGNKDKNSDEKIIMKAKQILAGYKN